MFLKLGNLYVNVDHIKSIEFDDDRAGPATLIGAFPHWSAKHSEGVTSVLQIGPNIAVQLRRFLETQAEQTAEELQPDIPIFSFGTPDTGR